MHYYHPGYVTSPPTSLRKPWRATTNYEKLEKKKKIKKEGKLNWEALSLLEICVFVKQFLNRHLSSHRSLRKI